MQEVVMGNVAIKQRTYPDSAYSAAMASGFTELQSRIIAARLPYLQDGDVPRAISPPLSLLDTPDQLPDIRKAVKRLADAIENKELLAILCDHDVDGGTSLAIIKSALCDYFHVPPANIRPYTSHRMREGYGVSDALVDRILLDIKGPALALTADQGSADASRVARLREHGIETIVTDHHEIPISGIPEAAVAVVNPTREDSLFPDRSIAGCYVAFLVMCATREELIRRKVIPESTPKLTPLLSYAACGTVADCVDLASSTNNRAIVRYGLYLMNTKPLPCWRAMRRANKGQPFTAETIGFFVGPRINGSGRVDNSMLSVDFLLSRRDDEANRLLMRLDEHNTERKAIQEEMLKTAKPIAKLQAGYGVSAIVIYLPNGHAGIHGICASRLVEAHGRPTVCFSPKQGVEGVLTGSMRSVEGVHLRKALDRASEIDPGCLISYGGHAMAAGSAIRVENLERFQTAFRAAVAEQKPADTMRPLVLTDGQVVRAPDLAMLSEIAALEPFGRQFPAPVFEGRFKVRSVRGVGDGRHLKLELSNAEGQVFGGIWFGAIEKPGDEMPVAPGDERLFVYIPSANTFRGNTTVDLRIQTIQPISEEVS